MASKSQWVVALALAVLGSGQTAERVAGTVTSVDQTVKQITIRTDAGQQFLVLFDNRTRFLRVAPGETDLRNAAPFRAPELSVGDRILARGPASSDGKALAASSVVVMTSADLAKKAAAERAAWEQRGIVGLVTAVNAAAGQVAVAVPSLAGSVPLTISLSERTLLRRYAPDSVKFSDAKPSRIEEIHPGDQVRARGARSEDGSQFAAEELVSGSFVNFAATVNSVNEAESTLDVTDLASKKRYHVRVNTDSNLRRMSAFMGQMLANRTSATGRFPAGDAAGRPRDLQSMLGRMPAFTLGELKAGEAVAVASTKGAEDSRITAITILAGVEPLLAAGPKGGGQNRMSSWSLDLNMNMDLP